jgi:hypothetical protein
MIVGHNKCLIFVSSSTKFLARVIKHEINTWTQNEGCCQENGRSRAASQKRRCIKCLSSSKDISIRSELFWWSAWQICMHEIIDINKLIKALITSLALRFISQLLDSCFSYFTEDMTSALLILLSPVKKRAHRLTICYILCAAVWLGVWKRSEGQKME